MNDFLNQTINQHFISQSEQRLNSINPNAKKSNQKIYSFKIINRDLYELRLENEKGSLIKNNLSFLDLYSFDIDDYSDKLRFNFEFLSNKYENTIEIDTLSLVQKIKNNNKDIHDELTNIFILKILNSFRNPYCINKTINTLKIVGSYIPTNKDLR